MDGGFFRLDNRIAGHLADLGPTAVSVYVALCCHVGPDGSCWPSVGRLADLVGVSTRTVWRAIAVLRDSGLIQVTETQDKGDRMRNHYSILSVTPPDTRDTSVTGDAGDKPDPCHQCRDTHDTSGTGNKKQEQDNIPTSSVEIPMSRDLYEMVEEVLSSLGIGDHRRLVEIAREAGYPAANILAIVNHWKAADGAWGAGGLHWRLTRVSPKVPTEEGWPPPLEAQVKADRKAVVAQRRADEREEEQRRLDGAMVQRNRLQMLEREFRPMLMKMSKAQRTKFARQKLSAEMFDGYQQFGIKNAIVLRALLEAIENREAK